MNLNANLILNLSKKTLHWLGTLLGATFSEGVTIRGAILRTFSTTLVIILTITGFQLYTSKESQDALRELALVHIRGMSLRSAARIDSIAISDILRQIPKTPGSAIEPLRKDLGAKLKGLDAKLVELKGILDAAKTNYRTDDFDSSSTALGKMQTNLSSVTTSLAPFVETADANVARGKRDLVTAVAKSWDEFGKAIVELTDEMNVTSAIRAGMSNTRVKKQSNQSLMVSLFGIGLTILFVFTLSRFVAARMRESEDKIRKNAENMTGDMGEMVTKLDKTTASLKRASSELSSSTGNLADSTSKQASAIEESIAALEEISSMVSETARQAADCSKLATETNEQVTAGRDVVNRMDGGMKAIRDSNVKIQDIVRIVTDISKKTKIINNIVTKTELLSFNASIEAARAGEHGRGFAVVAEEVGNLARMSGQAADEISNLVEEGMKRVNEVATEINSKVDQGTSLSGECVKSFKEIQTRAESLATMVDSIKNAAHEQERGLSQTKIANHNIEQATQDNQAVATQTSKLSEGISGEAQSLGDLMKAMGDLITVSQQWVQDSTSQYQRKRKSMDSSDTGSHGSGPSGAGGGVAEERDDAKIVSLYQKAKHAKAEPSRKDSRFGT